MVAVKDRHQGAYNDEYERIASSFRFEKKKSFMAEYESGILQKAHAYIYDDIADQLYDRFVSTGDRYQFVPEKYDELLDVTLLTCILNGSPRIVSVSDYFEYYNNKILKNDIAGGKHGFYDQIWKCVFEACGYQDAIERGITADGSFLQEKQIFKHRVMLGEYERDILSPKIAISSDDIERYYEDHIGIYSLPETVLISRIQCPTVDEALSIYTRAMSQPDMIDSLVARDSTVPDVGGYGVGLQHKVSLSSTALPVRARDDLLRLRAGMLTIPV